MLMSDPENTTAPAPETWPLPVTAYFDETVFSQEKEIFFTQGPGYVGHESMVPNLGDYHVLESDDGGRVLVRNLLGVELLSNICRHRQSMLLSGHGNTTTIVCPTHHWTYDINGKLLGAPHFDVNPCLHLRNTPLQNWKGFLFEGPRNIASDLAGLEEIIKVDFSDYNLDRVEVHQGEYNWKTFVEIYLDLYHVVPCHPGYDHYLGNSPAWRDNGRYSVQTWNGRDALTKPGTPTYKAWHDQVLRYYNGRLPEPNAFVAVYYPNVGIEWYSGQLIISTVIPNGPQKTTNILQFYYPEQIKLFEREFVDAGYAAYMETYAEDNRILKQISTGLKVLVNRGENDAGPYQLPLEDSTKDFHGFLRRYLTYKT
jgi:choline monooxygenase